MVVVGAPVTAGSGRGVAEGEITGEME